jgi:hypothetical protein
LVDVKPNRVAVFAKFNRQRQADVAQADDSYSFVVESHIHECSVFKGLGTDTDVDGGAEATDLRSC